MIRPMLLGVIVSVIGCSAQHAKAPTASKPAMSQAIHDGAPVIVRIVSRDQTVIVTSGPHEPLYSVRSADGRDVVANATLDELRTKHPEIYQRVEPSLAMDASQNGPTPPKKRVIIDASDA